MVKNTKGGKGSKAFARKNFSAPVSRAVRLPHDPLELIAVVTKMFGNMCDVTTSDNRSLKCHIRGKFKGRSKSFSFISPNKFVLVGLRDFEAPLFKNCDLLEVYDSTEVAQLFKIPSIDLSILSTKNPEVDDLFSYSNEPDEPLETTTLPTTNNLITIHEHEHEHINIDDI
jgi:hypothetical protein